MIQLSKKKKVSVITVLSLLILLFGILSILRYFSPKEVETEDSIYDYNFEGALDYYVYLKPNTIYDKHYLESDRLYISELTDFIDVRFNLNYSALEDAEISYNYVIYPSIESSTAQNSDDDIIWTKNYDNVSSAQEKFVGNEFIMSNNYKLYLDDYISFIDEVYKELDINTSNNLIINFKGNLIIEYDGKISSQEFSQRLEIPLKQKIYKIISDENFEISESIIELNIETSRTNIVALVVFICSIIMLILSIKFISIKEPKTDREITINKIFNEHSERLVQLATLTYDIPKLIVVDDFKDLLKIADEITQPIFYYIKDTNNNKIIEFLVFDNERSYSFIL
ncbi:hypothetical protein KHQ82_04560 [Mycoplasmatota bacterium]|nr:hypothetical protein KHQ82_04560 [Mycoplasmatota bacterium]